VGVKSGEGGAWAEGGGEAGAASAFASSCFLRNGRADEEECGKRKRGRRRGRGEERGERGDERGERGEKG
jgi:hypothetical protein